MSSADRGLRYGLATAAVCTAAVVGCSKPNAANIALRKQVQDQQDQIALLTRQHAADEASTRAATQPNGGPLLTGGPLDTLFTVHGIRFGMLTGLGTGTLSVHLIPTDQDGDDLKAAGTITVDAFDLKSHGQEVVHAVFDPADAMKRWNGTGLQYEYVLAIPLPKPLPAAAELTIRVTFVDALTGRSFDAQQVVKAATE